MSIIDTLQSAGQAVMKKAVELAPDAWMPGAEPDPVSELRDGLIGAPVSRVDGAVKVQGQARFAAEVAFDGMLYAALVHSTIAKGSITSLETAAAEAASGVRLVMTHLNAPAMRPMPAIMTATKAAAGEALPVMQDARVHWNGQPIAVVLADSQEQADHAATLVRAHYQVDSAVTAMPAALARGLDTATFFGETLDTRIGDAEAALAAAPYRVDQVYRTPRLNHNAIEPHAATVAWQGKQLIIHDASQAVGHMAWSMAHIFDIDEQLVHVSSPFVGGGFGAKNLWRHQVLAAAASKLAGRPVRINLPRKGVYRVVGGRANTEQRVALGAAADGALAALIHTGVAVITPGNPMPEPFTLPARCTYAAASFKLQVQSAYMDIVANTFMRAPGEAVGSFALESAIDELAVALDMDPIALRMRNEPSRDPLDHKPFSSRHVRQAYEDGAARFGWERRHRAPRQARDGEWQSGMGCATATYPYYRMPGAAARLTLRDDGQVLVEVAGHEMGMGTATVHTQVLAERLAVPLSQVRVVIGDSTLPGLVMAGGSQQTAAIGSAVRAAQEALFEQLLALAGKDSPLANSKAEDVTARDGGLCKRAAPEQVVGYAELLRQAGRSELVVETSAPMPLEAMHWSMHSFGAVFCEARVNAVTGEARVARLLGSFDCGRILNPKTARSQLRGGMIMGVGMALMEATSFDERNGRIINPSLSDYHLPAHLDVPDIDIIWTDIADPHTPMGARGIGEIGITGTAAAVANAIYNACGRRVRDLPITLDKLMED